jgi:hypothetical protein
MSRPPLALALLTLLPALASAAEAEPPRFRIEGQLAAVATSHDGRYTLRAEARVTPQQDSADGRFRMKSTQASCDPLDFSLFKDGFESMP